MKFNRIYVLCPKGVKTGGPELLHQLVYQINYLFGPETATLAYYGDLSKKAVPEYKKYLTCSTINYDDIEDKRDNVIIFPETAFSKLFNKYHFARKYIWWLSIDNYFSYNSPKFSIKTDGIIYSMGRFIKGHLKNNLKKDREFFKEADLHLCQSYYAENYLKNKEDIPQSKVKFLSDYVNDLYIKDISDISKCDRNDVVLYNPKKGYRFTKKIIKAAKDKKWTWVPLIGYSNAEVKQFLKASKVYIDFGNHPGKDRFPREAAVSGCCVITGKKGAAKYYQDVPIPEKYKFEDNKRNIPKIINKIENCINNYDIVNKDFLGYRKYIRSEKANFQKDVEKIFK